MKILLTISGSQISPRLDTTREILIVTTSKGRIIDEPRTILLDRSSAEDICSYIIKEDIGCVICGGIEDTHYKYLRWKKTRVIDSIIGEHDKALELLLQDRLHQGDILKEKSWNEK